ncbi:MAG: 30S ribosomal protein S20 [Gammaproteobacteria bacterium]|nr:MAG: 30S ribosomal protein S20 [Gammaproteobacteria bacterium]
MANSAQARKRARQTIVRRLRSKNAKSAMRTSIKNVLTAVEEGNKEDATTAYRAACSVLDKMVKKGHVHKNMAARQKRRLNLRLRTL